MQNLPLAKTARKIVPRRAMGLLPGALLCLFTLTGQALASPLTKFTQINRWDGYIHYRFEREQSVDEAGIEMFEQEGLHGRKYQEIEVSGPVSLRGRSGRYKCRGNLNYRIKSYDEARLGNFKVVDIVDGNGTASIHRGLLEIDLETGVYSFYMMPGDEDGVEVRSLWQQNISESIHREMEGAGLAKDFSDAVSPGLWAEVMGWFPEKNWNEDDRYQLLVQAVGIPLPAFSANLSGSMTNLDGAVVTWSLSPHGSVEPEFAKDSENWMHYHPRSAEEYEGYVPFWDEINEGKEEEERQYAATSIPYSRPAREVFLVKPGDNGKSGPKVGAADSLVAIAVPGEEITAEQTDNSFRLSEDLQATGGDTGAGHSELEIYSTLAHLFDDPDLASASPGLRNTIREHHLYLSHVQLEGRSLTIHLGGSIPANNETDRLRILGQMQETARQFEKLEKVIINWNGQVF